MVFAEPYEELRFAKIDGKEEYAFVHSTFTGKLLVPLKSQCKKDLSYNNVDGLLSEVMRMINKMLSGLRSQS